MYRVLIIDDEPFIVNGLYALFQELDDFELDVSKAYSGVEALKLLHKTKFDIILTDISMPKLSGLDLQEKIKEQWPKARTIFLTGFDDFDYVQTAIRQGGTDYVLKTEGDEEIIKAIKKAIAEIEEEMKNQKIIKNAEENMIKARPLLQEKLLLDLLNGIDNSENSRNKQFEDLNIPLNTSENVLIAMGCIDSQVEKIDRTKLMYGVQSIAEDYLQDSAKLTSIIYKENNIVLFLQPKILMTENCINMTGQEIWKRFLVFVNGTTETIQKACKKSLGISVSFVIGKEATTWNCISDRFENIRVTLSKGMGLEREMLLSDKAFKGCERANDSEIDIRYQLKKIDLLETYLENGQEGEFLSLFYDIMDLIIKSNNITTNITTEVYFTFANLFLSYMNRIDILESIRSEININKLFKIEAHSSWQEVLIYFEKIAKYIFQKKKNEYFTNTNNVIDFIENYVEKNLNKDISLTKLSDIVHLNPSYLSRLYKEYRNKSLSTFISELKITKAKKMLNDPYIKINEIAEAIGIDNASYFSRFFKKYTEMTASEYRESLS